MVELMVVVIIIAVVAALTIPNITRRMQERRASEAAQRVALMYQTARARAMGRGTAVTVRYTQPTQQGAFEILEAQRGPSAGGGCETLPEPSCTSTNWDIPGLQQYKSLSELDLGGRGEYDHVHVTLMQGTASPSFVDICFTPMGRTFVRQATNLGLAPLTEIYEAKVARKEGSTALGRTRTVMILPNGAARLQ
jgi:type IV fimbrial biogenesis protein FimT